MNRNKFIGNIVFIIALISPMISFGLASIIGEADFFGIGGIVRYSWIMWLFIPIGILSIIVGIKLKKNNLRYKKNVVIGIISVLLLLILGSYVFIFDNVSYNAEGVSVIEKKVNLDLPNKVKITTIDFELYKVSYAKIINDEDIEKFETELKTNQVWQEKTSFTIKSLLPHDIQYEVDTLDYCVFYNITNAEYNVFQGEGECKYIFIGYNQLQKRLIIVDESNFD